MHKLFRLDQPQVSTRNSCPSRACTPYLSGRQRPSFEPIPQSRSASISKSRPSTAKPVFVTEVHMHNTRNSMKKTDSSAYVPYRERAIAEVKESREFDEKMKENLLRKTLRSPYRVDSTLMRTRSILRTQQSLKNRDRNERIIRKKESEEYLQACQEEYMREAKMCPVDYVSKVHPSLRVIAV